MEFIKSSKSFFMSWCLNFCAVGALCMLSCGKLTEWPPIGKIAVYLAYDMFSWYRYLIVIFFIYLFFFYFY